MTKEDHFLLEIEISAAEGSQLAWNMLEHNRIEGLLPFQYYYKDDRVVFQYHVQNMQPVSEYFSKKESGFETLFFLCSEIIDILEKGEEYLLRQEEYMIIPERIYWNRMEKKVCLCYLPGFSGNPGEDYAALLEYLMQHTDHKDEKAVAFIYDLYDRVSSDAFSVDGLKSYFSSCNISQPENKKETAAEKRVPQKKYYLSYCGELWKGAAFWREGIGEYPLPQQEKVSVGRGGGRDVVIPCPEISRKQAMLFQEGKQIFLMDMGSANGTYLNDKPVSDREKSLCREGDCLRFANHCFRLLSRK